MKRILFTFLVLLLPVAGHALSVMDEAYQLGTTAGLATVCQADADLLKNFELVAVRIIANKSNTAEFELYGYRHYAEAKLSAIRKHEKEPQLSCDEILSRFQQLPLFQSIVYANGDVKMYDGTLLKAQRPVVQLKKKD